MNSEVKRDKKRPRLKPKFKREVLFSTDRVEAQELFTLFAANIFKKKDPFVSEL